MRQLSLLIGLLLVAVGLYSYFSGTPSEETGTVSKTALIPCAIGVLVILGGLIGLAKESLHKHGMHLGALAALVGLLGSFMPITRRGLDFGDVAVQGAVATIVLCLFFLVAAVRSFVVARLMKKPA